LRLVVVDNDSGDGTADLLREEGVLVIDAGANWGYGAACNLGARRFPEADAYVFVNPDVAIDLNAISALGRAVTDTGSGSEIGFAGPLLSPEPYRVKRFATLPREIYGLGPEWLRRRLDSAGFASWRDYDSVDAANPLVTVDFVLGAVLACRGSAFWELGGFDEGYFLYSEEEDLALRGAARGWRSVILPACRAHHAESTSSAGESRRTLSRTRLESRIRYYRLHRGRLYALVARTVIAGLIEGHCAAAWMRQRPSAYGRHLGVELLVGRNARRRQSLARRRRQA
jgi:GT2 family glycosyltransferase